MSHTHPGVIMIMLVCSRFSGQFSSLAMDTTCWFTLHSMVYFVNHFELPAVAMNEERDVEEEQEDVGLVGEIDYEGMSSDWRENIPASGEEVTVAA